jgi:hypothetical protein
LATKIRQIPESIQQHKYASIFGAEWKMIHTGMQGNSFNFFIGTNGTGKSYASLKRAEIIGVDQNDEYGFLFDPDHLENHVFFDKKQMMTKIGELEKLKNLEKTRGYQIILDEAQMSANAKDWNSKEVLNFSKDMTTIRSSRLSICLTMPTHRMITTDLRQLGIYQVQMAPAETIDLKRGLSHSKLHYLKLQPHTGDIWRNRPYVKQTYVGPISQLSQTRKGKLNDVIWKLPSIKVRRRYENLKNAFKETRVEMHEAQVQAETRKKSMFQTILESVKESWNNYKGLTDKDLRTKILKEFSCSRSLTYEIVNALKFDMEESQWQ